MTLRSSIFGFDRFSGAINAGILMWLRAIWIARVQLFLRFVGSSVDTSGPTHGFTSLMRAMRHLWNKLGVELANQAVWYHALTYVSINLNILYWY